MNVGLMNCTVCSHLILDLVPVDSGVTGHHKYHAANCIEGSPHRHESCNEARYDDSPPEMLEGLRKNQNEGGF